MIYLHRFGPAFGLPDASPFVVKTAAYLRMSGIPFEYRRGDLRKAPKQKLPYIDDGGKIIADSSFIVDYLRRTYHDLDVGISPKERAIATAFKSMVEEHLYFVNMALQWGDDRSAPRLQPVVTDALKSAGVPGFLVPALMGVVRKQVRKKVSAQGISRHSTEEVEEIGETLIDALAEGLSENTYFLGDQPRSIDATIFAFVWVTLAGPFENRVKRRIESKRNLMEYKSRLKAQFFADG